MSARGRRDALEPPIPEEEIRSWSAFEEFYDRRLRRNRGQYCFRGQADSSWGLKTTFERLLQRMGNPPPNLKPYPSYPSGVQARSIKQRVELLILRAFQARASKFLPNLPQLDDTLEWFALMRHWGLPNRLLDVTTSPYVGLYFALKETLQPKERTNQAAAVWVINHVRLRGSGALQAGYDVHANLSDPALYHKHFVGAKRRPLVAPVHPRTHNERLAAQQGTFLCYADIESSLEGNIDPSFFQKDVYPPPEPEYPPISFLKLRIDPAAAVGILARLSAMNIHQASLFPDLSGYT